jgi:hypothetical protein
MANRFLLAYDGSPSALKAFEFALQLLRGNDGGELSMLAVIKPSEFAVDFGVQALVQGSCDVLTSDMERLQTRVRFAGAHCNRKQNREAVRFRSSDWRATGKLT